jgi:hypothetical protein
LQKKILRANKNKRGFESDARVLDETREHIHLARSFV